MIFKKKIIKNEKSVIESRKYIHTVVVIRLPKESTTNIMEFLSSIEVHSSLHNTIDITYIIIQKDSFAKFFDEYNKRFETIDFVSLEELQKLIGRYEEPNR